MMIATSVALAALEDRCSARRPVCSDGERSHIFYSLRFVSKELALEIQGCG